MRCMSDKGDSAVDLLRLAAQLSSEARVLVRRRRMWEAVACAEDAFALYTEAFAELERLRAALPRHLRTGLLARAASRG
jgi:hypothetical protein